MSNAEFLETALKAAVSAGNLIEERHKDVLNVSRKESLRDIVTHVDKLAENQIIDILKDHNKNILYTPHLGENKKYTMIAYDYAYTNFGPYDGYYLAYSEDGITWTDGPLEPVIPGHADVGWFMYDNKDKMFRGIVKAYLNIRGYSRRSVLWTESKDALDWTLPKPAIIPLICSIKSEELIQLSSSKRIPPTILSDRFGSTSLIVELFRIL